MCFPRALQKQTHTTAKPGGGKSAEDEGSGGAPTPAWKPVLYYTTRSAWLSVILKLEKKEDTRVGVATPHAAFSKCVLAGRATSLKK